MTALKPAFVVLAFALLASPALAQQPNIPLGDAAKQLGNLGALGDIGVETIMQRLDVSAEAQNLVEPAGVEMLEHHSDLREIRFNLVLRTRAEDPLYESGYMQATENRAALGAPDGFRRRLLTTTVRPRNIGFRGQQFGG